HDPGRVCRPSPEQQLVERARSGDSGAFGELWEQHQAQVVAVCRRTLAGAARDPAVDEQDCAHDTFIRALHYVDRYDPARAGPGGIRAWLLEIARRVSLDALGRHARRRQWTAPLPD